MPDAIRVHDANERYERYMLMRCCRLMNMRHIRDVDLR